MLKRVIHPRLKRVKKQRKQRQQKQPLLSPKGRDRKE